MKQSARYGTQLQFHTNSLWRIAVHWATLNWTIQTAVPVQTEQSGTEGQVTRHFYKLQNNAWWWRQGCPAVSIKYYVTWHSNRTWYIGSPRWLPICTSSHTTLHLSLIYIVVINCQCLGEAANSVLYRMHVGMSAQRLSHILSDNHHHTPLPPLAAFEGGKWGDSPRPRSWGDPALQAYEFVKLYSPVSWKCWYMLHLESFFKGKYRSVVLGCLLYRNRHNQCLR